MTLVHFVGNAMRLSYGLLVPTVYKTWIIQFMMLDYLPEYLNFRTDN